MLDRKIKKLPESLIRQGKTGLAVQLGGLEDSPLDRESIGIFIRADKAGNEIPNRIGFITARAGQYSAFYFPCALFGSVQCQRMLTLGTTEHIQ